MMLRLLAATVFCLLSQCNAGDPCPPKAQISPCICSQVPVDNLTVRLQQPESSDTPTTLPAPLRRRREISSLIPLSAFDNQTFNTIVECKASKSILALEEIISNALNRKLVDKLVVANVIPAKENTLARLPRGWLKRVRVRSFEILNTKMNGDFIWYGSPFEGQERSLLWFSAHNCLLSGALTYENAGTINTKGLNTLPYVQGVDLSNNYLTAVIATAFRYPPTNLSTIILSRNSIQSIEAGAFGHTPRLRYVDLSHNLLESVVRGIFAAPARNLEVINLSWNSITALPHDFFTNMPAVKVVNISNNFLYSMPEKPWSLVWKQLTHIDVTGNFVECNCDLMWLLPILSPNEGNTTTPAPRPLEGQTVLGACTKTFEPRLIAAKYDLDTLTRDKIVC